MKKTIVSFALTILSFSIFAVDIHMAGDSTMQSYRDSYYPQQGWGQRMQELTIPGVKINNKAMAGRSSKSFKAEKRWENLLKEVKKGDYVIIQFGHNDGNKSKQERYAEPNTTYKENMRGFVDDVRSSGGIPILVTSIPQGNYLPNGHFKNYGFLDPYVNVTKEVAKEKKCDLVDLYQHACMELDKVGEKKGLKLYHIFPSGKFATQPTGKNDHTHVVYSGAYFYAASFVKIAKENKLPIANLFKDLKGDPMEDALKEKANHLAPTYNEADAAALEILDELDREDAEKARNKGNKEVNTI